LASATHKWRTFSQLSGFERGTLVEAFAGLVVTWLGLRLAGFRRWRRVLEWLVPAPPGSLTSCSVECARTVARMESAAARNLFFRPNCLERSLVLWWLLGRRGIAAELRIGARKDAQKLEAHAWVECGGVVIDEPEETHLHFVPFDGPIASVETPTH
jgi:hypothetical protein